MWTKLLLLTLPLLASAAPASVHLRRDQAEKPVDQALGPVSVDYALNMYMIREKFIAETQGKCVVGVGGNATVGRVRGLDVKHTGTTQQELALTNNPDSWFYSYGGDFTIGKFPGRIDFDIVRNSYEISRLALTALDPSQQTNYTCDYYARSDLKMSFAMCKFDCPKA